MRAHPQLTQALVIEWAEIDLAACGVDLNALARRHARRKRKPARARRGGK